MNDEHASQPQGKFDAIRAFLDAAEDFRATIYETTIEDPPGSGSRQIATFAGVTLASSALDRLLRIFLNQMCADYFEFGVKESEFASRVERGLPQEIEERLKNALMHIEHVVENRKTPSPQPHYRFKEVIGSDVLQRIDSAIRSLEWLSQTGATLPVSHHVHDISPSRASKLSGALEEPRLSRKESQIDAPLRFDEDGYAWIETAVSSSVRDETKVRGRQKKAILFLRDRFCQDPNARSTTGEIRRVAGYKELKSVYRGIDALYDRKSGKCWRRIIQRPGEPPGAQGYRMIRPG